MAKLLMNEEGLTIYIKNLPHLHIDEKVVGFHSWIEGDKNPMFKINFISLTKEYTTEYDNRQLWCSILKQLDEKMIKTRIKY